MLVLAAMLAVTLCLVLVPISGLRARGSAPEQIDRGVNLFPGQLDDEDVLRCMVAGLIEVGLEGRDTLERNRLQRMRAGAITVDQHEDPPMLAEGADPRPVRAPGDRFPQPYGALANATLASRLPPEEISNRLTDMARNVHDIHTLVNSDMTAARHPGVGPGWHGPPANYCGYCPREDGGDCHYPSCCTVVTRNDSHSH